MQVVELIEDRDHVLFMLRMAQKQLDAKGIECVVVAPRAAGQAAYLECSIDETAQQSGSMSSGRKYSIRVFYSVDEIDTALPWAAAAWMFDVRITKLCENSSANAVFKAALGELINKLNPKIKTPKS